MKQITENLPAKQASRKQDRGFTLIEVIVSVAIFSLIVYGITTLVSTILLNSTAQGNLLANNDSARRAAFTLIQELRNATTSITGGYPVEEASAQELIFYTNTSTGINRIRYYLQNGSLYKGITKPSGNPLIYNLANETVNLIQKNVANGVNPIFYYYDGTYNGVVDNYLAQPVNVTSVTFVKVNLIIYKRAIARSNATYTVTAGGAIRNLKTNLGS